MDSFDHKDKKNPPYSADTESTPPTLISPDENLKLHHADVEEALARARKKFTEEDFEQAISILKVLLQSAPGLNAARTLYDQVIHASQRRSRELFDQGVNHYMECDWDRASIFWKRALQITPDNETIHEWIAKAEKKKEQEKNVRSELLNELEECGKMLSDRNYVVAEEHLDSIKSKFTAGYRLADLQKIYEALVVRTRVELEKEFEDLRSNVIDSPQPVPARMNAPPAAQPAPPEQKLKEAQLKKQYMDAFEAGKKHFDNREWQKALLLWQTARAINPQDVNLIHWIALAENQIAAGNAGQVRPSPVSATFAFVSVFVVTAIIVYLVYDRYAENARETKNRKLVQLAIEHYRAGRLDESWKMLQIYVLQDPDNDSARTLLERITAEKAARESIERTQTDIVRQLDLARSHKASANYRAALLSYQEVLKIDAAHPEARRELEEIDRLVNSVNIEASVVALVRDAERLLQQKQFDSAATKLRQALSLAPGNASAESLLSKIETERAQLNRITAQLEVARFLFERKQKDSAILVLNRILLDHPNQPQARQLLALVRGTASVPKASIELRIKPAARLWIDGRDMGVSSYFKHLESIGTHILHIEQHGFKSIDQGIEVKSAGKNDFHFHLQPMEHPSGPPE